MNPKGTKREPALTALLVAEDRDLAQAVSQAVAGAREFEILSDLKTFPSEQTLEIRLRQIQPDVVLVDFSANLAAAEEVTKLVAALHPKARVIGLHRESDPEVLIRILRSGACEFLCEPFDAEAQKEAAQRIRRLREPDSKDPQDLGRLVVWASTKPGSGSTTLATQCAFALKRLTGQRVLLIDLDLFSGSIAFSLKLSPGNNILDALALSDQLDVATWSSLIANAYGIDVLAAPDHAAGDDVEFSRVREVVEYARTRYDWIVVDLPTVFHRLSLFALSESDHAFLVTTAELPSLHLARRAVAMLTQLGYDKERFQMIVNRLNRRAEITMADMQRIFACPISTTLPNDYQALHKVVTSAEALPPESELGRAIGAIAGKLGGVMQAEKNGNPRVLETKAVLSEG
ncbi:MAG: AAA family ATPase [Acidobacteria bacterium]|nr:AAA family ATPase [Acidobacteriota bacterium]